MGEVGSAGTFVVDVLVEREASLMGVRGCGRG